MKYAVLDTESTIYEKGHPFSERNRLCLVGIWVDAVHHIFDIEYNGRPYSGELEKIQALLDDVDLVVGFNIKHDLHWLARYGVKLRPHHRVWCGQLAEFILSHQQNIYPSLDKAAEKYGLPPKLDIVKTQFWDLGIDTPDIPLDILIPYLEQDLNLHREVYLNQQQAMPQSMKALMNLHMQDLLVLQEMEFNGIKIDWDKLEQERETTQTAVNKLEHDILQYVPLPARDFFNPSSNDHLSLLLYGGTFKARKGHSTEATYKSGPKRGQTYSRTKWEDISVRFERLVDPRPGTELEKEGYWSTDVTIINQLPKPKKLLRLLQEHSEKSKWLTTYCEGFPKIYGQRDWKDGCIHSQLNQVVARTGRLSSTKPNQQNMPEAMNEFIVSRFS